MSHDNLLSYVLVMVHYAESHFAENDILSRVTQFSVKRPFGKMAFGEMSGYYIYHMDYHSKRGSIFSEGKIRESVSLLLSIHKVKRLYDYKFDICVKIKLYDKNTNFI